jgi:hypothetical protein
MEHSGAVRVACWTVVGLLASIPAIADPVRITGGEFTASFTSSNFRFTGEGLSLSAIGGEGFAQSLFTDCRPCTDATPIPLSFGSATSAASFRGGAPGTFDGVDYAHTFLTGDFTFTGPSFSSTILSPANLTLMAPFSMTAMVQNYDSNPFTSTQPPLFRAALFGSGTATATFTAVPNGDGRGNTLFDVSSLRYEFEAPAATPEPASLLLIGTGLAGLAARKRLVR